MKLILALATVLMSTQALAYRNGTYTCKNGDDSLPANTYKISDTTVAGGTLPFVEITRHYRSNPSDRNSAVQVSNVKGLASVSSMDDREVLLVAAIRLEFTNDELFGCKQP